MESGNVVARALGNLGQGFVAGRQQAIDNQIRAAPTEESKRQFDASAPGREADVGYKTALTQDVRTNQDLKPTPELARGRYAAETAHIGAQTEAARAGALQSKASAARTTALTPAELNLMTSQADVASAEASNANFQNSDAMRGIRMDTAIGNRNKTFAEVANIGVMQNLERQRLQLEQDRAKATTARDLADIDFKNKELQLQLYGHAGQLVDRLSENAQKMYGLQLDAGEKERGMMTHLAGLAIQQGLTVPAAMQQATNAMKDYLPVSAVGNDPKLYASLNAEAQNSIADAMAVMSDPNVPLADKLNKLSMARKAVDAPLQSMMTSRAPAGGMDASGKPQSGKVPLVSRAESRKSELASRAGGGSAADSAAAEQLAREGIFDIKVNGKSVDVTPNYALPKGYETFGYEFDRWASANPQKFDEALARYRVKFGSGASDDTTAANDFKMWMLSKTKARFEDANSGSRQYGSPEGLFKTFSSYALSELR